MFEMFELFELFELLITNIHHTSFMYYCFVISFIRHELSKVSAIQDGRINIAHAKKKRRLDQEFERMLSRTQDKRDHLKRIESKLQELDDKRQEKEDQMKELERNLVALLVEQQKRLLSIIRTDPKIAAKQKQGQQKH